MWGYHWGENSDQFELATNDLIVCSFAGSLHPLLCFWNASAITTL